MYSYDNRLTVSDQNRFSFKMAIKLNLNLTHLLQ